MTLKEAAAIQPDAQAGTTDYVAVLRASDGNAFMNCQHRHRSRETAERCAAKFLLPLFWTPMPAEKWRP